MPNLDDLSARLAAIVAKTPGQQKWLADMRDAVVTTRQEPVTVTYVTVADAVEAFLSSLTDDEQQSLRATAEKVARASKAKADADDVFDALVRALATRVYSGLPLAG